MVHNFQNLTAAPLKYRDFSVEVPVDWNDPHRFGSLSVFAREVVSADQATQDLPVLLFLQGGPGGMSPRPGSVAWLEDACKKFRVVLLDQRGTGRSSPVTPRVLTQFDTAAQQAEYLACFRADSIISDAEHIRNAHYGAKPWATLGQSYGGFLTLSYLSRHPQALTQCYITGGVPWISGTAEDVYRYTFTRQTQRNIKFAEYYPNDIDTLHWLADFLTANQVSLPNGDRFTAHRLQLLGAGFGMSTGMDQLHWLLDTAISEDHLNPGFLSHFATHTGFATNPLYMVLQETIYHQGQREGGWAAEGELRRRKEYGSDQRPLILTGEAVFPWMFSEIAELRPYQAAAEELAARREWPTLYDPQVLGSNEVPIAAVLYEDDPYVDIELGLKTAHSVGAFKLWRTNEYLHDGLRVAGTEILPRLIDLATGSWESSF